MANFQFASTCEALALHGAGEASLQPSILLLQRVFSDNFPVAIFLLELKISLRDCVKSAVVERDKNTAAAVQARNLSIAVFVLLGVLFEQVMQDWVLVKLDQKRFYNRAENMSTSHTSSQNHYKSKPS